MATYQTWAAPIGDTLAHYLAWAQFFGAGFTTLGWVAQTGHGELAATGSGAAYAWTNPVLPVSVGLATPLAYTFKGAWVSGNTYLGGNSSGLTTECDVVTDSGVTYVHITSSSSSATAPGSDATNWQPLQFEIWKSNGPNTASLPIYYKIVYTTQGATNSPFRIHTSIGTGVDADGNLTNTLNIASNNPTFINVIDASSSTSGVAGEMDMAGDADNFRFILFRGAPSNININFLNLFVVDRSKNQDGADTDAFFYVGGVIANSGAQTARSTIMLNSALGGQVATSLDSGWAGCVCSAGVSNSFALFGSAPVFFIFPVIGYLAPPLLGAIGVHHDDYAGADGCLIPVELYGARHTYMVSSQITAQAALLDNGRANHGINAAILWE